MSESDLLHEILKHETRGDSRLFRQNVAQAWVGKIVHRTPTTITLLNPRPLHAGLCKGSSDLIGWTSIEVPLEMVGERLAIFTAIEGKFGRRAATSEQARFIDAVNRAGGRAGVARTLEQARQILSGER